MGLIVDVFAARSDNFGYLVHDEASGRTAAIDAPEAGPIRAALEQRGWTLTDIFITHHHIDHVEAIAELKAAFGTRVVGPREEADKIEGLDELVGDGDVIELGEGRFAVMATPGHTLGHVVFYEAAGGHLFSADALFSLGVGRMFEGTPGPMWAGLKRLRDLPDQPLVAVALTDVMPDGLSMVYSFYDPDMAQRSMGTFLILDHINQVRSAGLSYVYLGYWVKDSPKMAYKGDYRPLEVQRGSLGWMRLEE